MSMFEIILPEMNIELVAFTINSRNDVTFDFRTSYLFYIAVSLSNSLIITLISTIFGTINIANHIYSIRRD